MLYDISYRSKEGTVQNEKFQRQINYVDNLIFGSMDNFY